ncbi:MAG: hypothetical protein BWY42_00833 [Candidatus Omnitrophica bacterium ADurb.Bin277]|nr:MAG: hypothetical protein BWY42_00833 [Candidatus Omnitrophica bacterium ADurb.Bin277]
MNDAVKKSAIPEQIRKDLGKLLFIKRSNILTGRQICNDQIHQNILYARQGSGTRIQLLFEGIKPRILKISRIVTCKIFLIPVVSGLRLLVDHGIDIPRGINQNKLSYPMPNRTGFPGINHVRRPYRSHINAFSPTELVHTDQQS